jgi:hypothetical protein
MQPRVCRSERGESEAFYGGPWGATRGMERCWEIVSRAKRERKMASVMKVMVGLEGSRCQHDGRPRSWGSQGRLYEAYM